MRTGLPLLLGYRRTIGLEHIRDLCEGPPQRAPYAACR